MIEHAAAGRRDLVDKLAKLRDRRRCADEFGFVARLEFQFLDFAAQTRGFECASHDMDQTIGLEGLLDEIVGALLDRGDGRFDRAMTADHDDGQFGMLALQHIEHLDAVEAASLQPDVEHDQLRPAHAHGLQRTVAVARDACIEPFVTQNACDQIADILLVVDDENFRRHQQSVLTHATPTRTSVFGSRAIFCRNGNESLTSAPVSSSSRSASVTSPPWSSRIFFTMARPRPVPFVRVGHIRLRQAVAVLRG